MFHHIFCFLIAQLPAPRKVMYPTILVKEGYGLIYRNWLAQFFLQLSSIRAEPPIIRFADLDGFCIHGTTYNTK